MGECGIPPPVYAISGGGTYSGRALSSEKRLSAVMRYIWGTWGYLSPNVQCMDTQDAVSGGGKRIWQRAPACLKLLFSAVAERPDSQKLNRARWQFLAVAYSLFSRDVGHILSCASRSVRVWLGIFISMINSSLKTEPPCTLLRTSSAPLHLTFLARQIIETAELQKKVRYKAVFGRRPSCRSVGNLCLL